LSGSKLVEEKNYKEIFFTALVSEKSLAKDWLSKEEAESWKDL